MLKDTPRITFAVLRLANVGTWVPHSIPSARAQDGQTSKRFSFPTIVGARMLVHCMVTGNWSGSFDMLLNVLEVKQRLALTSLFGSKKNQEKSERSEPARLASEVFSSVLRE